MRHSWGVVTLIACVVVLPCAARADSLDLGDLMAGGNGQGTGQWAFGVRAGDGTAVDPIHWAGSSSGGAVFTRTDGSHGTPNLPYVNGVFRPDANTPISSTGLNFEFPSTNGNSWDAIRNGVSIIYQDNTPRVIQLGDRPGVARPGLGMHANSGITFDLDALRAAGFNFDAVRGVAGLNADSTGQGAHVDAWILVDGNVRYHQSFADPIRIWEPFSLELSPDDHLLSFVSTDFNADTHSDHLVFAQAQLFWPLAAVGDLNCDGYINFDDITPFVLAVSNWGEYLRLYPNCDIMRADINGDGYVDFDDINPFVLLLAGN